MHDTICINQEYIDAAAYSIQISHRLRLIASPVFMPLSLRDYVQLDRFHFTNVY